MLYNNAGLSDNVEQGNLKIYIHTLIHNLYIQIFAPSHAFSTSKFPKIVLKSAFDIQYIS